MFGFFRRKKKDQDTPAPVESVLPDTAAADAQEDATPSPAPDNQTGDAPAPETMATGDLAPDVPIPPPAGPREPDADFVPAAQPARPETPSRDGWSDKDESASGDGQPPSPLASEPAAPPPSVASDDQPLPEADEVSAEALAPTLYGDSEIMPPSQALPEAVRPARAGWFARLRGGLSRTRSQLGYLFSRNRIDEAFYDDLETALLASDTGYSATTWLLSELRERARRERITDAATLKNALIDILTELLAPLERPIDTDRAEPLVMMIAGVNGAGKTTSIGKLTRHLHQIQKSVLLAAGDTFRAAAREQLARWGERNQVHVIANEGGDPAAVAFDAIKAGQARGTGVVMIDTAGRLPTQKHLMEELKKIRRVINKAMEGAPHEVLLVLDGNTGQNMLAQVQAFDEAVNLTGLIVTKLDGTAKGGAIAALAHARREHPLPVYFIGIGEGVEDLQAFSASEFATALLD